MTRRLDARLAAAVAAAGALAVLARHLRRRVPHLALRRELAAAHHLSHAYKLDDLVWNHISARIDDSSKFYITSGTELFDEVTPESLVESTAENANITADVIHSAIYNARPDVGAIVHHHSPSVVAVSMLPEGLRFLQQDSAGFVDKVAYHNWEGVANDYDERASIAADLGPSAHTLIMRNHGACTVGRTVGEAWVRYFYLERCCRYQMAVLNAPSLVEPDAAVLAHAAAGWAQDSTSCHGHMEWTALTRQAERLQAHAALERLIGRAHRVVAVLLDLG